MRASDHLPSASLVKEDGLLYQTGFGNNFETEVLEGALPRGRNNPRLVPYNLYTEQISGTAFTAPRHVNRRTWLYRIQPSVVGTANDFVECNHENESSFGVVQLITDPNPKRWKPMPFCCDADKTTFISGLHKFLSSGGSSNTRTKFGLAIYMYSFNADMDNQHMYNSDGDFLFVPQSGSLRIDTELGKLVVHPNEICVVPRGIVFSVHRWNDDAPTRGYVLEIFGGHFELPDLGPIGSNGLANARDFLHPTAWCVDNESYGAECTVYNKFGGSLFRRQSQHNPYNVVAWHGNYAPFKYDLERFCAINSVTYDHLDPSIYTVLTTRSSAAPNEPLADFVIFPQRRVLATDANTLRPPWFHRNCMTEFMGLIGGGKYDAKQGFEAGGASLHSCMTPHGPDTVSYTKAVADPCTGPVELNGGLAFMFETTCILQLTEYAVQTAICDEGYAECWSGLTDTFTGWDLLMEQKAKDSADLEE